MYYVALRAGEHNREWQHLGNVVMTRTKTTGTLALSRFWQRGRTLAASPWTSLTGRLPPWTCASGCHCAQHNPRP